MDQSHLDAFKDGASWARMAAEKAFDEKLLEEDAKYYVDSGGNIRCRGDGSLRHVLNTPPSKT